MLLDAVYAVGVIFDAVGITATALVTRRLVRANRALRKVRSGYNINQRAFDPSQFHAPSPEDLK